MSSQPRDNSSRDSVLASYLADLSNKENAASKGGEGAIGVPHTIMQVPSRSDCHPKIGSSVPCSLRYLGRDGPFPFPDSVNSDDVGEAERCGPCTADCYENCGVWMPEGSEIRAEWESRVGDTGKLD